MGGSYHRINLHIVFSTKNRYPFLQDTNLRNDLFAYSSKILLNHGAFPIKIGGWIDHIHLLCLQSKNEFISETLRDLKISTSKWIKQNGGISTKFQWQRGFAVFSVSESLIPVVKKYIENQETHHRDKSFAEEYKKLLLKHNIKFDDKYLWD